MPIYEYVCDSCHNELEVIQKISEPQLTECPQCKDSTLKRKTSVSAFHLKGGGWYKDGYSVSDGNGKSEKADISSTKPAPVAESKTTDSKTDAKSEPAATKTADSKTSKTSNVPSSKAS